MIEAIQAALGAPGDRVVRWVGDDAAVVRARPLAVTSIDTLAEEVHFRIHTHSPADVGHKALGAALSDLAAMGAEAGEAYVSLALPDAMDEDRALELVEGMAALAGETNTTIAGGDVVRSPHWRSRWRSPAGPIASPISWAATAPARGRWWA